MVSSIVGNYLLDKGLITIEQFRDLLKEYRKTRVKLGLIAVAEGMMMQEEADRVNGLQAIMDKRFGDIAVEEGYLTEGQVDILLLKQGNAYLSFAQCLENQQLMSIEQLEMYMMDLQEDYNFTYADIEDLKSDNVDRILPLYIPEDCGRYFNIAGTAVRALMRCVDTEIYPDKAYLANECPADNGALQYTIGDISVTCALAGKGQTLLKTASIFGREDFPEVNEDALDALGELLNCVNGLFATALSQGGSETELYPPEYSCNITGIQGEMLVLPLYVMGEKIDFLIAIDNELKLKMK